jgi:hypothetical protein
MKLHFRVLEVRLLLISVPIVNCIMWDGRCAKFAMLRAASESVGRCYAGWSTTDIKLKCKAYKLVPNKPTMALLCIRGLLKCLQCLRICRMYNPRQM